MNLGGGSWMWSASLRFLIMLPLLVVLLAMKGKAPFLAVFSAIKARPLAWFLWSTIGFGVFYAPIALASTYGASWFVAASWQITIVCGVLLTPLFGSRVPKKNLFFSGVVLLGVFLMQIDHFRTMDLASSASAFALILLGAFCYPLGNRKMMSVCPSGMTTLQRVFGMTLCSLPFWLVLSGIATAAHGLPSAAQLKQAFGVALFSGVIATLLFFEATNLVRNNPKQLAVVEATQSGEVIFTLLGGLALGDPVPSPLGMCGILVIVAGMIANSLATSK